MIGRLLTGMPNITRDAHFNNRKIMGSIEKLKPGEGKTKVIIPAKAECKADGSNLVVIEVSRSLFATNCTDLSQTSLRLFNKKAYPFEKKKNTYLILLPIPSNRPDLSHDWWIKNRVYLKGTPVAELKYKNGYIIQKYSLSDKDIAVPADPNLPKDLHFR